MSSSPDRTGFFLPRLLSVLLLSLTCLAVFAEGDNPPADTEVWLVTYGPGEIYWQRFGHNAIWIRDQQLGLDHVFNFGFFDFGQEDFLLRFLQGRMLYFSAAQPAREEFSAYISENRSIRAQKLDLAQEQKLRLIEYLLEEVRPENRDYLYDYYENNCSTRVRDAIDLALGGVLKVEFEPVAATETWRDHTRRLTAQDFWLYLGLETGLGSPVDQPVSEWDEMFIPEELANSIATVEFTGAGLVRPLVLEDAMLYQSSLAPPPLAPMAWWPRYLLLSLGLVLLVWLADRFAWKGLARVLSRCWLVLAGFVGLFLLFLWFGTDHVAASRNLNLLVFNPLWLVLAFWKGHQRAVLITVGLFSVLALLMPALPPGQYTLDVLAVLLPLNLAAAVGITRSRTLPANRPGAPA
jgi:hypothetical protein